MTSTRPRMFRKGVALLILLLALVLLPACSANDPWHEDIYFTEVNSDEIYLGGSPLLIPAYAELYITEFETIECVVADTFYLVDGASTTGEILGFTDNGASRLTYTEITPDRICLINTAMTISVPVEDCPAIIYVQLFKNGVADPTSLVGDLLTVADNADSFPIVCLVELENQNDYLEIYVASSAANTTVVVNTLTLIATTVD